MKDKNFASMYADLEMYENKGDTKQARLEKRHIEEFQQAFARDADSDDFN